jgi:predicted P-loop ATPase/GTPase
MAFIVFIGGLFEYNSGKTTFAKELISSFEKDLSMKTIPFKPLSGNNLFFHYDEIKSNAENHDNLVSLDIVKLMEVSSAEIPVILANPVHKLNTQALPFNFYQEGSINTLFSRYSSSVSLMQRFTIFKSESEVDSCFLVNEPIYKNQKFWNDQTLTDPILEKAKEIKYFKNDQEFYSLNDQYYAEATKTSFDYIKKQSEITIVESFNNSAHPAWCIRESNYVVIVGPGSLFIYEPDAYFRAIDNYRIINRNKVTTTDEILKIATPVEVLPFPVNVDERKKIITDLTSKISSKIKNQ